MKLLSDKSGKSHTGAFFSLMVLTVIAAGVSIYLYLKLRAVTADIAWLEVQAKVIAPAAPVDARSVAVTNGPSHAGYTSGRPDSKYWKWIPDGDQVEQEARQVVSALGADFGLVRGVKDRLKLRLRFNELYGMLGLSDSEIAAFEREAVDKKLSFRELLTPDPAVAEAYKKTQADLLDRVVEEALGPDYTEPFRAFLMTSDLRAMTAELAVYSQVAGQPIDPSQAEFLLQTLIEFRRSSDKPVRIALSEVDWAAAASAAKNILTPTQQRFFEMLIERQNFELRFQDITGLPLHRPIRGLRP